MKFVPKFSQLSALASTNLFVLALRLVQFFFSGVVLGVLAYYIDIQRSNHEKSSSPYVFSLVVATISMLTQFLYCFTYEHQLYFLWDLCNAVGWLLAFFWLLDFVGDGLTCGWGAFNPFGGDRCSQTRSVLVMQIIVAVMWFVTSGVQAYKVWKHRGHKMVSEKIEVEV